MANGEDPGSISHVRLYGERLYGVEVGCIHASVRSDCIHSRTISRVTNVRRELLRRVLGESTNGDRLRMNKDNVMASRMHL